MHILEKRLFFVLIWLFSVVLRKERSSRPVVVNFQSNLSFGFCKLPWPYSSVNSWLKPFQCLVAGFGADDWIAIFTGTHTTASFIKDRKNLFNARNLFFFIIFRKSDLIITLGLKRSTLGLKRFQTHMLWFLFILRNIVVYLFDVCIILYWTCKKI